MSKHILLDIGETSGEPKYDFYEEEYTLFCKRYGEVWRDFVGDKAVSRLFNYALELQKQQKKLLDACEAQNKMLNGIRKQLIAWATESQDWGWSTHQVGPQNDLALVVASAVLDWQSIIVEAKEVQK